MRSFARILLVVAASGWPAGCGGGGKGSPPPAATRDWQEHPALVTLSDVPEIYALGDVHGDVAATASTLAAAGLLSRSTPYHWTGENRVLVVTGDVIDKGSTALPIIDLLQTIESEARAAGGQVVVTLGNHEAEFLGDPTDSKSEVFQAELATRGLDPKKVAAGETKYGAWLLGRPVAALIDGWFFCHAGNTGRQSAELLGRTFQDVVDAASGKKLSGYADTFLTGPRSLLEHALWWQSGGKAAEVIDLNLAALPAQHIVFGHDPGALDFPDDPAGKRERGEMVARYAGRIFLIDVGMSSAVGYSDGALLRIERSAAGDQATAVLADGTSQHLWP